MQNLRRLLRYLRPYRRNVFLNIFSNLMMAVFTVVSVPAIIPFLQILFNEVPRITEPPTSTGLAGLIDGAKYQLSQLIEQQGEEKALIYICLLIVALFFCKNLFRYLSLYFMASVRNGIVRDLRGQLFGQLLQLPLAYFSNERKGDLMARMASDVQEVEWSILNVLEAVFREPLIIIGCLLYMLIVSPSLTLFVLLLLLITGTLIGGISRTLKATSSQVQEKLGSLMAIVEESLGGLNIIKGFNAQDYLKTKFGGENDGYRRLLNRLLHRRDLSSPLTEFLGIAVVAVLLWYGSRQVFAGDLDAATFFSFLFAFFNVINPAKSFSSAFYNIQKGVAALDRIDEVLLAKDRIEEAAEPLPLPGFERELAIEQLYFAYNEQEGEVLKNITLRIPKGQTLALVGASGAGKSTLVDLITRFYDPTRGRILLDGQDIRKYQLKALRGLMGMVSQEAILFNDSIYNNIVFGATDVDREAVEAAARIANAHDFIQATESGYATIIGDRGSKLSGGQRQRLAIARAILRNPPLLILDEATSALDAASEQLVQEALGRIMQGRTAIVIAHRLSTIQHADQIAVFKNGQIVEQGNHETLLKLDGEYGKLVRLQAF
ncbi:MAG: ABC transporter ATP-binding protein [Bacteroidota bacterium]